MADAVDPLWIRNRVGVVRWAHYLRLAMGSASKAESLFRLDVALRDAIRPELQAVEVALRTRYHDVMTVLRPGPPAWLLDPSLPVRSILDNVSPKEFDDLVSARCSADDVVERVSFSFWRHLTASRFEKDLWVPYLHQAFEARTGRREVHRVVDATVKLRNRVHHYNTVVDQPVDQYLSQMFWLLDRLMPDLGAERRTETAVPGLLTKLKGGS